MGRRFSYYDRGHPLANEPACHAVSLAIRQKFDRALDTWLDHKPQGPKTPSQLAREAMFLRDFIAMTDPQRLQLIDTMWQEIISLQVGNTPRDQMIDPAPNAFPGIGHIQAAFRNHGYCFRCDTRQPAHVLAHGFRRAYELGAPADIQGTLPHRAAMGVGMAQQLGMWLDNRDAINEMTICVSRNMKGCTKFPSPTHLGAAFIYAIKLPGDKLGFDTENWQATTVGGLWRPGEKAFYDIAADNVIAHVSITKHAAAGAGELHRFQINAQQWTYTGGATYADRAAIGPELTALYNGGNVQAVQRADDFVMGE